MNSMCEEILRITDLHQGESSADNSWQPGLPDSFSENFRRGLKKYGSILANEQQKQEQKLLSLQPGMISFCPYSESVVDRMPIKVTKNVNQERHSLVDDSGDFICNFSVTNVELIRDVNKNVRISFEIITDFDDNTRLEMGLEEFRDGTWYKKIAGLSCFNLSLLRRYLEKKCEENSKFSRQEYPTQGWYEKDGGYHFVKQSDMDKTIIRNKNVKIWQNHRTEDENCRLFWEMRNLTNSPAAKIILVYSLMASLFTLLKSIGFPPTFLLGIVGPRSCQKTSLALAMANLYDRQWGMRPPINFSNSTPAGLEQKLELFKDSIMIVDDLKPTMNSMDRKKIEANLEHLVRLFGDNVGTTGNTDFFSKEKAKKVCYTTKGLCLFTGEYFTGVASSRSRCVILDLAKDEVNKAQLRFYQKNIDVLPGFLYCFVNYVEQNQNSLLPQIAKYIEKRRFELQNQYNVDRFSEYQSVFEIVFYVFLHYLQTVEVLTEKQIVQEKQQFQSEISCVLHANQAAMESNDPIKQIVQALQCIFHEHAVNFCDLTKSAFKADYYIDDNYVYLHPQSFFKFLKEFFESQGISCAVLDSNYMKTVLMREKYLCTKTESGRRRKTLKIPYANSINETRRFLRLKRDILD